MQQEGPHDEDAVRHYVLHHPLVRPRHALLQLALVFCAVAAVSFGAGYGLHALLGGRWSLWPSLFVASLLVVLLSLRPLVASLVRLYQRYAPDDMRRNCLLMPTCSEYCLLAMERHGSLKGCAMTLHRLLHTCKGDSYREDWP